MTAKTVIYSWGYYGWGNCTRQLLGAVNAVEEDRGFKPPLFVDIRILRKVRARGFIDAAFEKISVKKRYIWMPSLGNKKIMTGIGPTIQIVDSSMARTLLDRATGQMGRRLIFFCSCRWALAEIGGVLEPCHRHEIGRLILEYAGKATPSVGVEVVEWPGGVPIRETLKAKAGVRVSRLRGRKAIPLVGSPPSVGWLGLPWGSAVELRCDDGVLHLISGPAFYRKGGWQLPVLGTGSSPGNCLMRGAEMRRDHGLDPRS